jgi:hypothetical protein
MIDGACSKRMCWHEKYAQHCSTQSLQVNPDSICPIIQFWDFFVIALLGIIIPRFHKIPKYG